MHVDIGAPVRSSDGQDIGSVDRLIMDPNRNDVTAAVIRKGMFLPRDVEVQIDDLRQASGGGFSVNMTAEEVKNLPEFYEANYSLPPPDYLTPAGYTYGSLYWPTSLLVGGYGGTPYMGTNPNPAGTAAATEAADRLSRDAWENAVIGKGSTVTARDGKNVGKVEDITFDSNTGAVTELVMRTGLFSHTDHVLDPGLIESVDEGVVYLNVDSDQMPE
ncbi:MAG TPA: PRC-barrel domain-containing protein [Chloroflexota bacterium]|nr:PRC-barrel domain-containing protein [Chloroflexota bacterium]